LAEQLALERLLQQRLEPRGDHALQVRCGGRPNDRPPVAIQAHRRQPASLGALDLQGSHASLPRGVRGGRCRARRPRPPAPTRHSSSVWQTWWGGCFLFLGELPYYDAIGASPGHVGASVQAGRATGAGPWEDTAVGEPSTILVADDSRLVRSVMARAL